MSIYIGMCRPKTVGYLRRFGLKTGLDSLLREKRPVDEVGTGYGSQGGKRARQIPGFFEVENFRLRYDFWKGKFWHVFLEYLDFSRDFFGVIKTYVSIFALYHVMFSGSFYGYEIRHRNFFWCYGVWSRDFLGSTSFPCLFFGVCVGGGGVGLIFPPFDHPCHLKFRSTSPGDGSPRCDIKQ